MTPRRGPLLLAFFSLVFLIPSPALSQCTPYNLTAGQPQTINCSTTNFTVAPVSGHWNAAGITSTSNWDMTLLPAISTFTSTGADFVVSNGHLGTPTFTTGTISRVAGTGVNAVVLEHVGASQITVNSTTSTSFPAGTPIQLFEFDVVDSASYVINVSAVSGMGWVVFGPGSNANWRQRSTGIGGAVSGSSGVVALGPGSHAIAVFREGGVSGTAAPYTISLTCGPSVITPVPNTTVVVSAACQYFEVTPVQGLWNVIAMTSLSDWNINIGGVGSNSPLNFCDAVVANGHLGSVTGGAANFDLQPGFGSTPGWAVHAVNAIPLTLGTSVVSPWSANTVLQVFEFYIPQPELYDIVMAGPQDLQWEVQLPGGSSGWRGRSTLAGPGGPMTNPGIINQPLGTGWHALLFMRDGGVGTVGNLNLQVRQSPHPVPTLSTVSPPAVAAGGPGFVLDVFGNGFVASSQIKWAGSVLATTVLGPTHLQAFVPGSSVAGPGQALVEVFTPPPAGGTSAASPVVAYAPVINAVSPSLISTPMQPTSQALNVSLSGSTFGAFSSVYANGVLISSNAVSSTVLDCTLPPSIPQTQSPGGIALTVVNHGTVLSNSVALHIGFAANEGTIVTDPPAPAPGATFSLKVEGGGVGQAITLVASAPPPAPWTFGGTSFLVGIDLAGVMPIVDGLGLFGPPTGTVFGAAAPGTIATPPGGVFVIPGLVMPSPALGLTFSLQAAYADPAPPGFKVTWARSPFGI